MRLPPNTCWMRGFVGSEWSPGWLRRCGWSGPSPAAAATRRQERGREQADEETCGERGRPEAEVCESRVEDVVIENRAARAKGADGEFGTAEEPQARALGHAVGNVSGGEGSEPEACHERGDD